MPQSSAVSLEKKAADEWRKSRVPAKVPLTEINEYLVCQLCFGYLIDATAIIECQHTFCKSCILNYLEKKNNYCPICEVQLNEAKPHLSLRSDEILQKLVYKLVPGLVSTEVQRRREHIAKFDSTASDGSLNNSNGNILLFPDVKEAEEICFLSPNDLVSLSLEYFKSTTGDEDSKSSGQPAKSATPAGNAAASMDSAAKSTETSKSSSPEKKTTCNDKANDRRYLKCPAAVSVGLLKKFIRMKYGLSDDYRVDLLYNGDRDKNMENDLTLLDLSFIFKWKKAEPMCFHYRIFDRPLLKNTSVRSGTKRAAPSIMDEPPDDDAASGPTSRSSMMFTAPSKFPRLGDGGSSSNTTSSNAHKNNTGKGQGKKSSGGEDSHENTIRDRNGKEISSLDGSMKTEGKGSTTSPALTVKTEGNCSQFNLRITTTTSPLGSSMTSKLSPSSSSCSSSSSPPSPLKISLPLKALTEGKSHHHHRHHHRHHKEKKRHRSSKSKDKDKDRESKGRDKDKERYKYNAHPNPSQSQTISVKPGKLQNQVKNNSGTNSPVTAKTESTASLNIATVKEKLNKEKERAKVGSDAKSGAITTNGGKNCAAISGLNHRLSISSASSSGPNLKSNNSLSVSKVVERRSSASSPNVLTLINANSGSKGTIIPEQQRKVGRPSLASKVATAAAAATDHPSGSSSSRGVNSLNIPESVHLQVPKSVTLIPVNPPGGGGNPKSNRLSTSEKSGGSGRLSAGGMGNPHTFTHPITNKSLHQITVTEVPPPPKSGTANTETNYGSSGSNSSSSNTSSAAKSIEKSIQSLSARQFNGPGSMEITKIYCDNTKSSTSSNCSVKVFEERGGKKLKGLDISISPSPPTANTASSHSGASKSSSSGCVKKDDGIQQHTTQKLSVSLSKSLPKIPGVSILPQTQSHLIAKTQQHQSSSQQKNFGSSTSLMNTLSSKMNEKHSNRLTISAQPSASAKNPLTLPGDSFSSGSFRAATSSSSPSTDGKTTISSSSGGRTGLVRKQIGETTRTPSPPQKQSVTLCSSEQQRVVAAKGKIKRPFESTFSRKESGAERISPDSGPNERKREKLSSEHDSPLDLSGKSSRSTPSPAEGDNNTYSPTSGEPKAKERHANQKQGQTHNLMKGHQSGGNKSQSATAHTQTILTIAQNLAQKQSAEMQRQQHRAFARSKSMNGAYSGAGSPPMLNTSGGPYVDPLGNLMTLSNAAARVRKLTGQNNTTHSISNLVAASSIANFPGQNPLTSASNHLLSPHFGAHHHMNMNLMSPPQLKPTLENPNSLFPNFGTGGLRTTTGGNSLSPPLTNPFLPSPAAVAMRTSPSTSLRIPNLNTTKLNATKSSSSNSSLFPSHKTINSIAGTLSTKPTLSSSSPSARPNKINGNLTTNTFVAPSSIIPISKTQTQQQQSSAKSGIPNSMKISNFLPSTKSTSMSANTNATITSSSSLAKYLNSIPPTPTIEISNNNNSAQAKSNSSSSSSSTITFSIDSLKSTSSSSSSGGGTGKSIVSTMSSTLQKCLSATTGYKLASTSSSDSESKTTSSGGKSCSGTNSGSSGGGLGALGIALGLYPREPPTTQATQQQQQNQAVRHIPNPSQIFFRQNHPTTTTSSYNASALVNNNTIPTKLKIENGIAPPPAKSSSVEKILPSSSTAAVVVVESLEVIKPAKPEPLPSLPLSDEPPKAVKIEKVDSHEVEEEDACLVPVEEKSSAATAKVEEIEKVEEIKIECVEKEENPSMITNVASVPVENAAESQNNESEEEKSLNREESLTPVSVEISLQNAEDIIPAGSVTAEDNTQNINSGEEKSLELEKIPTEQVDEVVAEVEKKKEEEKTDVEMESVESVIPALDSKEKESQSFSVPEVKESEIIPSAPGSDNEMVDETVVDEMEIEDDSQEATTEDDDEAEAQVQLSLENIVTQVENNKNAMETLDLESPMSLSPALQINEDFVEMETESEPSPSSEQLPVVVAESPKEVKTVAEADAEISPSATATAEILVPVQEEKVAEIEELTEQQSVPTVNPESNNEIPEPEPLPSVQITEVEEPLIQIPTLAKGAEVQKESPVQIQPIEPENESGDSKPAEPEAVVTPSSTLSELVINTTTPPPARAADPPKSLLIPSPTFVSMSLTGRSRSGSPCSPCSPRIGLNSPGSEKKVDLKKMENLEKVAAGLLASAASNINNNNNMIMTTTASTCAELTSAPSNPVSAVSVANPPARSTPPPIANV